MVEVVGSGGVVGGDKIDGEYNCYDGSLEERCARGLEVEEEDEDVNCKDKEEYDKDKDEE